MLDVEPYWVKDDPPEAAQAEGFEVVYFAGSTAAEWDRYEALGWQAVERFYRENPGSEVARRCWQRTRESRGRYFGWERRHLGWGVFVLRAHA